MLPLIFDTDQHITEPPDLWVSRLPKKHQEMAPRVIEHEEFKHGWSFFGGQIIRPMGLQSQSSTDPRQNHPNKRYEELDPGCFDPRERVKVLDIDGVKAALIFPSVGGTLSNAPNEEIYLACLKAYNDGVMEWSREGDSERLVPAALIPAIGIEHAMAELDRTAKMGYIHYMFNQWPSGGAFPTQADDLFFDKVEETGMTVSFHGYGQGRPTPVKQQAVDGKPQPVLSRGNAQEMIAASRGAGLGCTAGLGVLILSGLLDRHSKLRIGMIETSAGWLPSFAERMDALYLTHRFAGGVTLKELPSDYIKRLKLNMDREWLGYKYRDQIGMDNLMFATDYPHFGSFYPHTRFYVELVTQGMTGEEIEKLLWGNAAALYGVN